MADVLVLEGAEAFDGTVDHGGGEDAVLFVEGAVLLKAVGRFVAGGGELFKGVEELLVLLVVDVHVDVGPVGDFEGVGHFKAGAGGGHQAGEHIVDVGAAVAGTHLHGLLVGDHEIVGVFERVGDGAHAVSDAPAQWHSDEHRAVAVAPADAGGRFLVGHQAEVGGGVRVAEGRERGGELHIAGDGAAGVVGQGAVLDHHGAVALHHPGVEVQAAAGLAGGDLRGEGHVDAVLVGQRAEDPFGHHQLVGRRFHGVDEEFDLVLLVDLAVEGEVAHFAVAVLDLAAHFGDGADGVGAEALELGEGRGFVVAVLVFGGEHAVVAVDQIEFEFTHRLEGVARPLPEGLVGLAEGEFRRAFERQAVFREIAAEEADRGDFLERIDVGRAETGNHIKVAAVGGNVREETGAVHPLAIRENGVEILPVRDREVQRLEPPVGRHVAEIDNADLMLDDVVRQVFFREGCRLLADGLHQWIDVIVAKSIHIIYK